MSCCGHLAHKKANEVTNMKALQGRARYGLFNGLGALTAFALFLFLGCLGDDETRPPAPTVDLIPGKTSLTEVRLSGYAEYGARVVVNREPALADGALETRADSFSARFALDVPLAVGRENEVRVTAVDEAGNESEPAVLVVSHEAPEAEALSLGLEPAVVDSASGVLKVTAQAHHREEGVDLSGLPVEFEMSYLPQDADERPGSAVGTTDSGGRAEVFFTNLDMAGEGTITAISGEAGATAGFVVSGTAPGTPVALSLALGEVDGEGDPSDELTVEPAAEIEALVSLEVEGGGAWPVVLSTDAPGAVVDSSTRRISGITREGTYLVRAQAAGTTLIATAILNVVPAAPSHLHLDLSHRFVPLGVKVPYRVGAFDEWGNSTEGDVSLTVAPVDHVQIVGDANEGYLRFGAAGSYEVTAHEATQGISSSSLEVVVVGGEDEGIPTLAEVASPRSGAFLYVGAGGTLTVEVDAESTGAIAEVLLQVRGDVEDLLTELVAGGRESATVAFEVDLSFEKPAAAMTLLPAVRDVSGRMLVGEPVTILVNDSRESIPADGVEISYVAGAGKSLLSSPRGIAMDGEGRLLVANADREEILRIDPGTGEEEVLIEVGHEVHDVLWDDEWGVFVSADGPGNGGVHGYDSHGHESASPWSEELNEPRGLRLFEGELFVAVSGNNEIHRFDPEAVPAAEHLGDELECDGEAKATWGFDLEPNGGDLVYYVTNLNDDRIFWCRGENDDEERLDDAISVSDPRDLIRLGTNDFLVADRGNHHLIRYTCSGGDCDHSDDWQETRLLGGLDRPVGLHRDEADGSIHVTLERFNAIVRVTLP